LQYLQSIKHDQELAESYIHRSVDDTGSLADILIRAGHSVADVMYMFAKTAKRSDASPACNIGRDLVSGSIDVDRVSYLSHDSARTGVPYGQVVDAPALADALCIWPPGPSLAIHERGISAVEGVLSATYWMYRNVYWKPANRGFMAAVKFVMERLLRERALTFEAYEQTVFGGNDWSALEFLDASYASLGMQMARDWYNPLRGITEQRRATYARVYSLGWDDGPNGKLYDRMAADPTPMNGEMVVAAIKKDLGALQLPVREGEILIDIPLKKRLRAANESYLDTTAEAGSRPLLMVRQSRRFESPQVSWVTLSRVSPLSDVLGNIEDYSGRKIRVFFSNELIGRIDRRQHQRVASIVYEALKLVFHE
jgi:hypothetical protein